MTKHSAIPALRFPEFDKVWDKVILGKHTNKIGSGVTPRGGASVYLEAGVPLLRSQNVRDSYLEIKDVAYISVETHESMNNSFVLPNDILLNITGASIGRSCIVPANFTEANVNQHVCIIRLKDSIEPKFLQSILASYKGQILILQAQTGGGREGLNFESIKRFKLIIPSKPEQQKIAEFLGAVDEKIAQLQKKKDLLEDYKKGCMQKLFSQEIRFTDDNGNPFPDWEEKALGKVAQLQGGYAFKSHDFSESGIPIVRISNISANTGYIDLSNAVKHKKINGDDKFIVRNGDVLIALSGATTGKACEYAHHENAYLNQRVGMFKLKDTAHYYPYV